MNLVTQSLMNKLRIYVLRKISWNLCHRYYLKMEGEHRRLIFFIHFYSLVKRLFNQAFLFIRRCASVTSQKNLWGKLWMTGQSFLNEISRHLTEFFFRHLSSFFATCHKFILEDDSRLAKITTHLYALKWSYIGKISIREKWSIDHCIMSNNVHADLIFVGRNSNDRYRSTIYLLTSLFLFRIFHRF